jgi:hypothetical protein
MSGSLLILIFYLKNLNNMSCDLTNGRLLDECLVGRAGIKTLFYAKLADFSALTGITETGGEITSLGSDAITIHRFEMADNVGSFEQAVNASAENGTVFIGQTVNLTLFNIVPADLADLNNLKVGRWVIFTLDFQGKIRIFGRNNGCVANGGSETSGTGAGDKKGLDMSFYAEENDYADFMGDYTTAPFDNFANVTVTPTY